MLMLRRQLLAVITLCNLAVVASSAHGIKNEDEQIMEESRACSHPTPEPIARPRLRRAMQNLTDSEWERVTAAMWVMRTTDTRTGQARYGSGYYDWEYFVLRHVVSSVCINQDDPWRNPDLDTTGHDLFAIWHGVQLIEFENALISVDPEIEGLPFLDYKVMADELRVAHTDADTVFSRRLGSTAKQSNVAGGLGIPTDGPFAWWPVPSWPSLAAALAAQPGVASAFGGNSSDLASEIERRITNGAHGQLRSCTYEDNAALTDRVPYLLRAISQGFPLYGEAYALLEEACSQNGHQNWWINQQLTDNVTDLNWKSMSACLEGQIPDAWDKVAYNTAQALRDNDPHEKVHLFFGGDMAAGPPALIDPIFWMHHAYFDRIRLAWQRSHAFLEEAAWGIQAEYLDLPLGYASDTLWTQGYRANNYSNVTFSMAWDRDVLLGRKDASLANLSVGAHSLTVRDAMCGPLVPGVYYTYDFDGFGGATFYEKATQGSTPSLRPALLPPWWLPALVAAVVALLIKGACGRSRRLRLLGFKGHSADDEPAQQGYDMGINDAALPRAAEAGSTAAGQHTPSVGVFV